MELGEWATQLVSAAQALESSPSLTNFLTDSSDVGSVFFTSAADRRRMLIDHAERVDGGGLVLVGEAAGWRGARQSGIAFTDPEMLGLQGTRENSARTVHGALALHGMLTGTLLWNALPVHPHELNREQTNRTPSKAELILGYDALEIAVRGRAIVCVGGKAASSVAFLLGFEVPPIDHAPKSSHAVVIRHPSYGGANVFRRQMAMIAANPGLLSC